MKIYMYSLLLLLINVNSLWSQQGTGNLGVNSPIIVDSCLEASIVDTTSASVLDTILEKLDSIQTACQQLLITNRQVKDSLAHYQRPIVTDSDNRGLRLLLIGAILGVTAVLFYTLYHWIVRQQQEEQEIDSKDNRETGVTESTSLSENKPKNKKNAFSFSPLKKGMNSLSLSSIFSAKDEKEGGTKTNRTMDSAYFFGEVMVTAGPRKNFSSDPKEGDYGLGEDIAGFISLADTTYFWVLDGTSNSGQITMPNDQKKGQQIELFSSRLLAQTIAWQLQAVIQISGINKESLSAQEMLSEAIRLTEIEWRERLEQLAPKRKETLKQLLLKHLSIECSTTVVFGKLNLNGQLEVSLIGDSSIITFPASKERPYSKERQFARLTLNQQRQLEWAFNPANPKHIHQANTQSIIAFTDGLSPQVEYWLNSMTDIDFSSPSTRRGLAHAPSTTQDDKAICMIQIKHINDS